jgi:hypothetical protein
MAVVTLWMGIGSPFITRRTAVATQTVMDQVEPQRAYEAAAPTSAKPQTQHVSANAKPRGMNVSATTKAQARTVSSTDAAIIAVERLGVR